MTQSVCTLQSACSRNRVLRLSLFAQENRFTHTAELVSAQGDLLAKVNSLEGSGDSEWPPSPPCQDWSREQRGDTSVLMLLGMAGKNHWSLSIEPLRGGGFFFDVACRVQQTGGPLQSSYLYSGADSGELSSDSRQLFFSSGLMIRLSPENLMGRLIQAERQFAIVAAEHVAAPATIRWSYELCLIS